MLDDLEGIQSRIADIQAQIAALSPPEPATPLPGKTFGAYMNRAQQPPATSNGEGAPDPGVSVPQASLGPLPPLPLSGAALLPVKPGSSEGLGTARFESLIQKYAQQNNLSPALVKAVIQTESGGNPQAVSKAGAMGLMQLMPANVQEAGIDDPFDPEENIAAGTKQLSDLLGQFDGNLDYALAGYNAGPGNVRKYGGVPPFRETQDYIKRVRAAMAADTAP